MNFCYLNKVMQNSYFFFFSRNIKEKEMKIFGENLDFSLKSSFYLLNCESLMMTHWKFF